MKLTKEDIVRNARFCAEKALNRTLTNKELEIVIKDAERLAGTDIDIGGSVNISMGCRVAPTICSICGQSLDVPQCAHLGTGRTGPPVGKWTLSVDGPKP